MLLNTLMRWGVIGGFLLGASACAHQPSESSLTSLPEGSRWVLDVSDVAGLEQAEGSGIEIRFEPGRIAGYSGCNQFSGSATLGVDGALELGPMVSSKRACVGPGAAREAALFGALQGVKRAATIGEDRLLLVLGSQAKLEFSREALESE